MIATIDRDQETTFGPNFEKFRIDVPGVLEYIGSTLFDTRTYTSASTLTLEFFSSAQARDLTNLELGNMIPAKQGFLAMSIRWFPKCNPRSVARAAANSVQTGPTNDIFQLQSTGRLSFKFENKEYGQFPLWMLPSGGGVVSAMSAEGATADPGGIIDHATNGNADARNMYVLEQPLFLPPQVVLGCRMDWPTALTLASGNTAIVLALDGMMVRSAQ